MSRPSDYLLAACLVAGLIFTLNFSLGRPRVWFRDRLGWVIFLYSLAVDALLVLIVYGVVFGQPVDEPYRFVIALALLAALLSKNHIVNLERREGRPAYRTPDRKVKAS